MKTLLCLALLLSFPTLSQAEDRTADYERTFEWVDMFPGWFIPAFRMKMEDTTVVFVPGFLSDTILEAGDTMVNRTLEIGEYFDEQMRWLKRAGIPHIRVPQASDLPLSKNAERLVQTIDGLPGKVAIVTHSRGGLVTLEALKNFPEIKERIKSWVPLQAPFLGSPQADEVLGGGILSGILRNLSYLLGGNRKTLEEMRTTTRKKYIDGLDVQGVVSDIPCLAHASHADEYVPHASALLEGCDHVTVDVDHLSPVTDFGFGGFEKVRHLKALLFMATPFPY